METEQTDIERAAEFKAQGNEFFKKKDYLKAIETYTKAIDLNQTDPSYYANRAACYLAIKKYNKCIEDCDETLHLDRNFTKAWMRKGRSYYYLGQLDDSKTCYRTALEIDPNDKTLNEELKEVIQVDKMLTVAKEELKNNKYTNALSEVKQVLRICPDSVEAKIRYLEVLIKMGNIEQAIQLSTEYFRDVSSNVEFLYYRGLALCYNGQTEAAKKTWIEAMRQDPDYTECRLALKRMNRQEEAKEKGNVDFKSGNYEGAVTHYSEGITSDPFNKNIVGTLYANRAAAYMKMKKYPEALADCDKAIEINEGYAKAYLRRGDIKMEMENYEEASRDYNKAHQLDPNLGARQKVRDAEKEAKKAARKDYYKILGVEKTASDDEIKKAYKKLALKWHPDKNSGDEEQKLKAEAMFKDINEAYSILSDPQKRQRFDSGADLEEGMGGFGGDFDPNIIFRTFFGGGGDDFGGGGFGGFPGGFSFGGNSGGSRRQGGSPFNFTFKTG